MNQRNKVEVIPPGAQGERFQRIESLTRLMDSSIEIPGTGFKIGLDGIIGLIPGIGDTLTTLVSLYLVNEARQMGLKRRTQYRMLWNVGVDLVVGAVPVVGDLFDFGWKANRKNMKILRRELGIPEAPRQKR